MDCYYSSLGDYAHAFNRGFVDKSKVIYSEETFLALCCCLPNKLRKRTKCLYIIK